MKHLITLLFLCLTINVSAQEYVRKGTEYYEVSADTVKFTEVETNAVWVEKDGQKYVIYLSKNGRAFIKKVSAKSGKEYKKYLPELLSKELCKRFNVKYVENPAKL